jgi:hypothetical protein
MNAATVRTQPTPSVGLSVPIDLVLRPTKRMETRA